METNIYIKESRKGKNTYKVLTYKFDCRECDKPIEFDFIEYKERYCDVKCAHCGYVNKKDTSIMLWDF